ncbi:MAG: glycerophosphodiester phosphodiesterase [Desulfobacterium sp.]|nr:glycerophosphodiester phosphodiesterase [Desulfobacterium sp.]
MSVPPLIENSFHFLVDLFFARWPQPVPTLTKLQNCKIISHRGEHDNRTVIENTMQAFDIAHEAGVWGIEFDIRWTKDLYPVVFHDQNLIRLFQINRKISEFSRNELQQAFPMIPTLSDVIQKYGKTLHLMVEIKEEAYPEPEYQNQVLKNHFSSLAPKKDFHILSLCPEMFSVLTFTHKSAFLPVSEMNFIRLSRMAFKNQYCGISGHYLFLSNRLLKKHRNIGQKTGTGFISSQNALFRELNRGIDWIFSNHALKIQRIRNQWYDKSLRGKNNHPDG